MAKAKKKSSATRKRTATSRSQSVRRMRSNATAQRLGRVLVPLFISLCLLGGIGFIAAMGYRTATASDFFGVRTVEIRGTDRSPVEDIRRIVTTNTEKSGVWNADLPAIREKIEKLPFVKAAAVSMALPAGIRLNIVERIPQAIVRLNGGDFLVDGEGVILAPASKPEPAIPFVIRGWDESKSEKAMPENLARLKLYRKMLDEWNGVGIADRVKEVNLADLNDPTAIIVDSGRQIPVAVAKNNLGKSLKSAIEAVAGKGEKVKAVNSGGVYPVLEYLGY